MPVTLLIEPNPNGHRFQAAANVAALAARAGKVVFLTSAGARDRPEFAEFLAGLELSAEEPFGGPAPATPELARVVAESCRTHDADTVVVMDADVTLKKWWLVAPRYLRGLPRRPRIVFFLTNYPARLELSRGIDPVFWRNRIAKALLVLLAMCTRSLHRASGFAGRDETSRGWLVKRARDPALCAAHSRDRARLRAELGLPADRKLVGIFGGVNARKNPELVFQAVLLSGPDVDLLLAGPMTDDVRAWLDARPAADRARIIVADGFLPNDMLDRYLASSDAVALLMKLEGPSGIQGKALAAGVPVVTAGSRTRERELLATHGGAATAVDADSFAAGIRTVLQHPDAPIAMADFPTAETFAAAILGISVG